MLSNLYRTGIKDYENIYFQACFMIFGKIIFNHCKKKRTYTSGFLTKKYIVEKIY